MDSVPIPESSAVLTNWPLTDLLLEPGAGAGPDFRRARVERNFAALLALRNGGLGFERARNENPQNNRRTRDLMAEKMPSLQPINRQRKTRKRSLVTHTEGLRHCRRAEADASLRGQRGGPMTCFLSRLWLAIAIV